MEEKAPTEVTRLLLEWRDGDEAALDRLMPVVYQELRRVAQRCMAQERGVTLQATALVNEAYLRLVDMDVPWTGKVHFFAIAASLMRRILVDEARKRRAQKRGSGAEPLALEDVHIAPHQRSGSAEDLLVLNDALERLGAFDERKARVLELRFFAGLTIEETAEALELSRATVERDLKLARAWLARELRPTGADSNGETPAGR